MPYYPTNEKWTWTINPTNPECPSSPLLPSQRPTQHPCSPHPPRQAPSHCLHRESQPHQPDNGWAQEQCQSTLPRIWSLQPPHLVHNTINTPPFCRLNEEMSPCPTEEIKNLAAEPPQVQNCSILCAKYGQTKGLGCHCIAGTLDQ
jgi:hypothetical protein